MIVMITLRDLSELPDGATVSFEVLLLSDSHFNFQLASLRGVLVLNIPPPPLTDSGTALRRGMDSFPVSVLVLTHYFRPDIGLRIVPFYGGEKLGNDNTFSSRAINKIIDVVVNR